MSVLLPLAVAALIVCVCVGALILAIVYNKPICLIYFQIVYCCTMRFFISEMNFPSALRFVPDLVTMILFIQCALCFQRVSASSFAKAPLLAVGVFFLVSLISFVINAQPVESFIWGIRVVMRFFVFWLACILFLRETDVRTIVWIFFFLTVGNTLAVSLQYFIQGYSFDYVGGLFGVEIGANSEMNLFLVQMFVCGIAMYAFSQCSWKFLAAIVAMGLYIAAISELKVVFLELPMVFFALLLCAGWRPKCAPMLLVGLISVYLAGMLFLIFYPGWTDFFSLSTIKDYVGEIGYAGEGTLNRTTAVPYVFKNILISPAQWLFGYGLGNADASSFYTSEIYRIHGATRYQYFSMAHFLAENGVLGILAYLSFYVATFAKSMSFKRRDPNNALWYVIGAMGSILVFFHAFYSLALRIDITYIYMFWLSLPYIVRKEAVQKKEDPSEKAGTVAG